MSNKKLIQQYATTGIIIPEYQFDKLSGNIKNSYIRGRTRSYNENYPLENYELEHIQYLPEKYRLDFIRQISTNDIGLRLKLRDRGVNVELPNTDFEIEIDTHKINDYIYGNDYDSSFFEKFLSDNDFYDYAYEGNSYQWVNYDSKNEKTIKDYIRKKSNGEIDPMLGTDDTSDIIGEFIEMYDDVADELQGAIGTTYSDCTANTIREEVFGALKHTFSQYGEVLSINDEGVSIKTSMLYLIKNDIMFSESIDDLSGHFEGGDWAGMFEESTLRGETETPEFRFDDRNSECNDTYFNELLADRLLELE